MSEIKWNYIREQWDCPEYAREYLVGVARNGKPVWTQSAWWNTSSWTNYEDGDYVPYTVYAWAKMPESPSFEEPVDKP